MDLTQLRQEYTQSGLERTQLNTNPFKQFEYWFTQATQGGVIEPNAMQIATVSLAHRPSLRTVLLKSFDEQGFVFFTNYNSQKARDIQENSQVALLFFWKELERQVEISGHAEKISIADSLHYFTSRPRGSQIGAWVSNQSHPISSRAFLEHRLEEMQRKFGDGPIPLPDFWGGYRVVPNCFEFWQGRPSRLHDRFEYRLKQGSWDIQRLAP